MSNPILGYVLINAVARTPEITVNPRIGNGNTTVHFITRYTGEYRHYSRAQYARSSATYEECKKIVDNYNTMYYMAWHLYEFITYAEWKSLTSLPYARGYYDIVTVLKRHPIKFKKWHTKLLEKGESLIQLYLIKLWKRAIKKGYTPNPGKVGIMYAEPIDDPLGLPSDNKFRSIQTPNEH